MPGFAFQFQQRKNQSLAIRFQTKPLFGDASLKVYNALGVKIVDVQTKNGSHQLDTSQFPSGYYKVVVVTSNEMGTKLDFSLFVQLKTLQLATIALLWPNNYSYRPVWLDMKR
jgi:catalase